MREAVAPPERLSDYDEGLPFPAPPPEVPERFAELRRERPAAPLHRIGEVVVVVSSSRGGSTLLAELLRRVPGLVTLPGELNAHVAIARGARHDRARVLLDEIAREAGAPAEGVPPSGRDELVTACRWRLLAQWPDVDVDATRLAGWVDDALAGTGGDRREAWADDGAAFTVALLAAVRAEHPQVDPWRYDLPAELVARCFPGLPRPAGPPSLPVIEMAPYRLFRPWLAAGEELATGGRLVLVTPRNCYRLDHLAALLPHARLRVLHLTRNPAAAVNGLLDGWHDPGFFAGTVDRPLRIGGWSDVHPWGDRWWSFDLPPEWESVAGAGLAEVAALQWRSAHAAALAFVRRTSCDHLRIRHEDVLAGGDRCAATMRRLAEWLDVDPAPLVGAAERGVRPVMATAAPRPRRWEASADRLAAALGDPDVWALVPALGYGLDPGEWV
ncbi:MAG: sulfotransferase [Frankiaceae bacterium]